MATPLPTTVQMDPKSGRVPLYRATCACGEVSCDISVRPPFQSKKVAVLFVACRVAIWQGIEGMQEWEKVDLMTSNPHP